jgi:iron complex transport system substrate-binding protein
VQEQTGIPYALLDGRFDAVVPTYRTLGALVRRSAAAEVLAQYAEDTMAKIKGRISHVPAEERPKVYYARGPRGLETGLAGSINVETIEFMGVRNAPGDPRCR